MIEGTVNDPVTIGDLTRIGVTDGSIAHYSTFDIAEPETVDVHFTDGGGGRHLARVVSGAETRIDGTLISNGHVYLLNPAGILFGQTAEVNVGGLHAAAAQLDDTDFATRDEDGYTALEGTVTNLGQINADVANLIGRFVSNAGTIATSEGGTHGMYALVAGEDVFIGRANDELVVRIEGLLGDDVVDLLDGTGVSNSGAILAGADGQVFLGAGDLHGLAIHHAGGAVLQAGALELAAGGQLQRGGGDILLEGEIQAAKTITGTTRGGLDVRTDLTAADEIVLSAGEDEIGLLTIENRAIASRTILLAAGDGIPGGRVTKARIDLGGSTFRDPDDPTASPETFSLRQDAELTTDRLPDADAFGASGVAGMQYGVESADGQVVVEDASKLAGSQLSLASPSQVLLDANLELESLSVNGRAAMGAESLTADGTIQFLGTLVLDRSTTDGDGDQLLQAGGQLIFENPVQKATSGTLTLRGVGPTDPENEPPGGIRIGSDLVVGFESGPSSTGGTLVLEADEVVLFGELPDEPAFDQRLAALTEFTIAPGQVEPEFGRAGAIEATGVIRKEKPGDLAIETETLVAQGVAVQEGELRVTSRRGLDLDTDLSVLDPDERLFLHAAGGLSSDLTFSGAQAHTLTAAAIELNARPDEAFDTAQSEGLSRVVLGETLFAGVDADGNVVGNPERVRIHQDAPIVGTDLPALGQWAEGGPAGAVLELESNGGTRTEGAGETTTVGSITLDQTAADRVLESELVAKAELITVDANLSAIGIDLQSGGDLDVRGDTLSARSISLAAGDREGTEAAVLFEGSSFTGQDAENPLVSFALRQGKAIAFDDVPAGDAFPDGGAGLESFSLESLSASIDVSPELADVISGDGRAISLRAAESIQIRGDLTARELEAWAKTQGSTPEAERDETDVGLLIGTGTETTTLAADVMTLRAGDRLAEPGDTDGDERVTFQDVLLTGLTAESPLELTLRQDAVLKAGDLPGANPDVGFGGDVTGMAYTLRSDAGTVLLNEDATVDGTALTLVAVGVNIDRDDLRVFSLDSTGLTSISGNVTATGLTSDAEGNPLGNITLRSRTDLDGAGEIQTLLSEGGDVQVMDLLSRLAGDVEIVARRDVALTEIATQGEAGEAGGNVLVRADTGDIDVTGRILTSSVLQAGSDTAPDGGDVRLEGFNVSVGPITTISGEQADGADVQVAHGGTAGDVEIVAREGGTITLAESILAITLAGTEDPGSDGAITLDGQVVLQPADGIDDLDEDGRPELQLSGSQVLISGNVAPALEEVPDPENPEGGPIERDVPVEFITSGTEGVTLEGDVFAAELLLRAGLGGTGDLVLAGKEQGLGAETILLRAGGGAGGAQEARIDLGDARFFGEDGDGTSPLVLQLRQDAAQTSETIAGAERFGAGIDEMIYDIASFDGTIEIGDPTQLTGSDLLLTASDAASEGPAITIGLADQPSLLDVHTLVTTGDTHVQGDLAVESVVLGVGDVSLFGASTFGDDVRVDGSLTAHGPVTGGGRFTVLGASTFEEDVSIDGGSLIVTGAATVGADLVAQNDLQIGESLTLTSDAAQLLKSSDGSMAIAAGGLDKATGDLTVSTGGGFLLTDDGAGITVGAGSLTIEGDYDVDSVSSSNDLRLMGHGTIREDGDTVLRSEGELVSHGISKTGEGDLILGASGDMTLSGDMESQGSWVAERGFSSDADLRVTAGDQVVFVGDVVSSAAIDVLTDASVSAESISADEDISFHSTLTFERSSEGGTGEQRVDAGGQLTFEDAAVKRTTGDLTLTGVTPSPDPDGGAEEGPAGGINIGTSLELVNGGTLRLDSDRVELFGSGSDTTPVEHALRGPQATNPSETGDRLPGVLEATGDIHKTSPGLLVVDGFHVVRAGEISAEDASLYVLSDFALDVDADLTVLDPEEKVVVGAGLLGPGDLTFTGTGERTLTAAAIELNAQPGAGVPSQGTSRVVLVDTRFAGVDADGNVVGNPERVRIHQDAPIVGSDLPALDRWAEGDPAGAVLELTSNGGTRIEEPGTEGGEPVEITTVGSITLDQDAADRVLESRLSARAERITVDATISAIGIDLQSEGDLDVSGDTLSARSINLVAGEGEGTEAAVLFEGASFTGQDAENPLVSFALRQDKRIAFDDVPADEAFPDGGASLEFFGLESLGSSIDVDQDLADLVSGEGRAIALLAADEIRVEGDLFASGLVLESGRDGTGNLVLAGIEPRLGAESILLRAGDGSDRADVEGDTKSARVVLGDARFFGETGEGSSPLEFLLRQDASHTSETLPGSEAFPAGVEGMVYEISSYDGSIDIGGPTQFTGSNLILRTLSTLASEEPAQGPTITVAPGLLDVNSLDTVGETLVEGDLSVSGSLLLADDEEDPTRRVSVRTNRGGLSVGGAATFAADVTIDGGLSVGGAVTTGGDLEVLNDVEIGEGITLTSAEAQRLEAAAGHMTIADGGLDKGTGDLTVSTRDGFTLSDDERGITVGAGSLTIEGDYDVHSVSSTEDLLLIGRGKIREEGDTVLRSAGELVSRGIDKTGDGDLILGASGDMTLSGDMETQGSWVAETGFSSDADLTVNAGDQVVFLGDLISGEDHTISLNADDGVQFDGDIFADAVQLRAGLDGTGDLVLAGTEQRLGADSILLKAGNGPDAADVEGDTRSARVVLGDASFLGAEGEGEEGVGSSPLEFHLRQDASLTSETIPGSERFSAGIEGMTYEISALDGSIDIGAPASLAGSDLILRASDTASEGPAITIGLPDEPSLLQVESLFTEGETLVQGDVAVDSAVSGIGDLSVLGASSFGSRVQILDGSFSAAGPVTAAGNLIARNDVEIGGGISLTGPGAQRLEATQGQMTIAGGIDKEEGDLDVFSRERFQLADDGGGISLREGDLSVGSAGDVDVRGHTLSARSIDLSAGDGEGESEVLFDDQTRFTRPNAFIFLESFALRQDTGIAFDSVPAGDAFPGGGVGLQSFVLESLGSSIDVDQDLADLVSGSGRSIALLAADDIRVGGDLFAGELELESGRDGTGDLLLEGAEPQLGAASILLSAGDGSGGNTTSARVDLGGARFFGEAGEGSSPADFALRQDASLSAGAIPGSESFSAGVGGMTYELSSFHGTIDIEDPTRFTGTHLSLGASDAASGGSAITIGLLDEPSLLDVASLSTRGETLVQGDLAVESAVLGLGDLSVLGASTFGGDVGLVGSLEIAEGITLTSDDAQLLQAATGHMTIAAGGLDKGTGDLTVSTRDGFLLADEERGVTVGDGSLRIEGDYDVHSVSSTQDLYLTGSGTIREAGDTVLRSAGTLVSRGITKTEDGDLILGASGDMTLGGNMVTQGSWVAEKGFSSDTDLFVVAGDQVELLGDLVSGEGHTIGLNADNGIQFEGDISADSVQLRAGLDGSGDLVLAGAEQSLRARTILVRAGDGPDSADVDGETQSARVVLGLARFFGPDGPDGEPTAPSVFSLVQDASLQDADLPELSHFGGPIDEMTYSLAAWDGSIVLDDPSRVEGAGGLVLSTSPDRGATLSAGGIDVANGSLQINGDFDVDHVSSATDLLLMGQGTFREEGDTVLSPDGHLIALGVRKTGAGSIELDAPDDKIMQLGGRMEATGDWTAKRDFRSSDELTIEVAGTATFEGDVAPSQQQTADVHVIAGEAVRFEGGTEGDDTRSLEVSSLQLEVNHAADLKEPVIFSDRSLRVDARSGGVSIAPGNKLNVEGDAQILAAGAVGLSDVNALSIVVDAPEIRLHGRAPGRAWDADGNETQDLGVDLVANQILFSSVPTLKGGGSIVFGTPTGTEVSEQVARGGAVRAITEDFRPIDLAALLAKGGDLTPVGPAILDTASQSHVEVVATSSPISETIVMVRAQANTVAGDARPLWANELLAFLDPDLLGEPSVGPGQRDARLESDAVRGVAHLYRTLLRPRHQRDDRGERVYDSQAPRIRSVLDRAVAAYRAAHGDAVPSGAALLAFVEQDDEQFEALDYLQRTAALIRSVRRLEMRRPQVEAVEDVLLGRLGTDSLPPAELGAAVEELLERPSASASPSVPPNGS